MIETITIRPYGRSYALLIKRMRSEKAINETNHRGESNLNITTQVGSLRLATLLITAGADVDLQDENGFASLHHAINSSICAIVRALGVHVNGANVNCKNNNGDKPMHLAIVANHTEMANELIKSSRVDEQQGRRSIRSGSKKQTRLDCSTP